MGGRMSTSAEVAAALGLTPHAEGGFFRETYRSPVTFETSGGSRCLASSILYLVDERNPSRFHRLASDEMWFFHDGVPLEMTFLGKESGRIRTTLLGRGDPQVLVPAGVWMAARVAPGEGWTLAGCVVSPGFEYQDFERADRDRLLREFPGAREIVEALG
jgi:predicted cupin superfamily sugar epimerase